MSTKPLSFKKNILSPLPLAIGLLIFGGLAASLFLVSRQQDIRQQAAGTTAATQNINGLICTADAKLCPDGTYVSRDPQNGCQFSTCPPTQVDPDCPNRSFADINQDCVVETKDLQLFLEEFRKAYPPKP